MKEEPQTDEAFVEIASEPEVLHELAPDPQPTPAGKPESKRKRNAARIRLVVFAALVLALMLVVVFASQIAPYDPYEQNLLLAKQPPSAEHILGTDRYGRDLFSRVLVGGQSSILSALALVAIIAVLGCVLGVVSAWFGGAVDTVIMRTSDIFLAFPGLVFALAVAGVLGGGLQNAVIALAAISWPKYARLARSQTLAQKNGAFVDAARLAGCSDVQIIVRHLLPNILGPILVTAMLDIGTMMMELAGLSYLGLGAMPPQAEWGSMMSDGRSMLQTAPWIVLAPGVAIFISVALFNLLGDAVRDYMDPNRRNS